jgi:hypothetical protein
MQPPSVCSTDRVQPQVVSGTSGYRHVRHLVSAVYHRPMVLAPCWLRCGTTPAHKAWGIGMCDTDAEVLHASDHARASVPQPFTSALPRPRYAGG